MGSPTGILSKDQQILSNNGIAWDSEDEVVLYRRLINSVNKVLAFWLFSESSKRRIILRI